MCGRLVVIGSATIWTSPGHDGGEHGRRPAIGHVHDVDAGFELEQFGEQVRRGAEALRAPADLARIGLGVGHHLGQRLHRQVAVNGHDLRRVDELADRHERLDRIVADVGCTAGPVVSAPPGVIRMV